MKNFKIEGLDHVAIRVKDPEVSASWYEQILGLKRYDVEVWGSYPIFLLSGKTGVALFPAEEKDPSVDPASKNVKIDHFAFYVTRENFDLAISRFKELGVKFNFQDHIHFHSVYTKDPDGHMVELTTMITDPEEFYT